MGREVRMVPADWKHPKRDDGEYLPLYESGFERCLADWDNECAEWDSGIYPDYASEESKSMTFADWYGRRPEAEEYMPTFPEGTATHCMMYEDTTEGTPISPAFATPEELAKWLSDTGASSFGSSTASYEGWLRVAKGGFAPSCIVSSAGMVNGVDAL